VTVMELIYGAEKSSVPEKNLAVAESFLARLVVMDYNHRAAEHTGQLRTELRKQGKPIGPYDQMIAGHARSLGLVLVTNNVREFDQVPLIFWSMDITLRTLCTPYSARRGGLGKGQSWPNMISSRSFPRTIVIHIGKFQKS
jgi:predicted nucleic acid-binding protein